MELDELKKSWNLLNEQLVNSNLINEQAVNKLIMDRKSKITTGINKIAGWGKFSLFVGLVFAVAGTFFYFLLPEMNLPEERLYRMQILICFFAFSLLLGFCWDLKTYLWMRNTNIEEMPILTVIERINKFKLWTRNEIVALVLWMPALLFLIYYSFEFYTRPLVFQATQIIVWIILIPPVIYLIYKKMIYDNLEDVKRNIADINELKKDN